MVNQIQEWINKDDKLYNLIIEVQSANKTPAQQAEMAFNRICELYEIPKMPEDIISTKNNQESQLDTRSLFEEHALLKFLSPENEDPRGIVLSAAHNLLNNHHVSYYEVAKKEFNDIPEVCQIGVSGSDYNSKVVFFQRETKNWDKLDCLTIASVDKKPCL